MNGEPTYEDGVKNERSRCIAVCEHWKLPSYIAIHYGPIDAASMIVLQKVVAGIEADIANGEQPV